MPLTTLTVALGVVGSLFAPLTLRPAQFVSLILVGAFVGAFVALLTRSIAENRTLDSREALVEAGHHAAVGAVWTVAGGVVVLSLGGYGWAIVAASLLAYAVLRGPLSRAPQPSGSAAGRSADHSPQPQLSSPPLENCSTSELVAAWGASYELLQAASSPLVKARIAALRGAYLDELERRDRHGVRRWLSSGVDPASDTGHYFRTQDEDGTKGPA